MIEVLPVVLTTLPVALGIIQIEAGDEPNSGDSGEEIRPLICPGETVGRIDKGSVLVLRTARKGGIELLLIGGRRVEGED